MIQFYNSSEIINTLSNKYISKDTENKLQKVIDKIASSSEYVHITTAEKDILHEKTLKCSSGGLGGVVYVVPFFDSCKMHNLGEYIFNYELPMFLRNNKKAQKISMLKLTPKTVNIGIVDYLDFGTAYLNLYKQFEQPDLLGEINKIHKKEYTFAVQLIEKIERKGDINSLINSSTILKMLAFESLLECLFMRQSYFTNNEMDNRCVKDIVFNLSTKMSKRFNLKNFYFDSNQYFKAASESGRIDMDNFDEYFNFLLSTKSKKYLLNNSDNLKGHIIFRYFDFRKKMEYEFAQQLWQEAREKGINTLTYVLPKGEMGLLPTELRKAEVLEYSSKHRYVDLRINAQLSNNSIMRNPFNNNERS